MEPSFEFLKLIEYQNVLAWDIKSFSQNIMESNYEIALLKDLLVERNKKIKIFEYPEDEFKILGVNNQTGLFDAYLEKGKKINQPYKKVENGYFAYNPYRINVGSIGLKSEKQTYEYISPAYVVFSCKERLLPEYLEIFLKTSYFNECIKENTTGSVRQTLSFNNLCNIVIPVPSLTKQGQLVAKYNSRLKQAEDSIAKANGLEASIDEYLIKELGIESKSTIQEINKLFQTIEYKNIDKWGLGKHYGLSARYPIFSLENMPSAFFMFKRGKSPNYDNNSNSFAINQKCVRSGFVDLEHIKPIDDLWCNNIDDELKTKKDDILINSTGEGTIGRAAIINDEIGFIYDSHVLNLRLNQNIIIAKFFIELFNKPIIQKQIDLNKSATSTKQTELGVENAKKIKFPLPPLDIQTKIVEHITNIKKEIEFLRADAKALKEIATLDFEQEVFNPCN